MTLRLLAPAKVNLTFEALARRADGYHEVRSVMQAISLADEIEFEPAAGLSLTIERGGPAFAAPPGEANLVMRAARLLQREAGAAQGAAILLRKRIPAAAGLGGGAGDAAAALLGLRRLWGLDLDADALRELAARLGSDVPFFVSGGTALAEGRGERLTPLPTPQGSAIVAHSPDAAGDGAGDAAGDAAGGAARDGKTASLYAMLAPEHFSDGRASERLAAKLRACAPLASADLCNAFEAVAPQAHPSYAAMRDAFDAEGMRPLLCGAGPAAFALAPDGEPLDAPAGRLARRGVSARVVWFRGPWGLEGVER